MRLLFTFIVLIGLTTNIFAEEFRHRASKTHNVNIDDLRHDDEVEIELGRKIASRILGKFKISKNMQLNEYLTIVGRGISRYSSRTDLSYYFALLETQEISSYHAPGGYIFITLGMLNSIHTEAELAAILAHEISHIAQKHILNEVDITNKVDDDNIEKGLFHFLGSAKDPSSATFSRIIDQSIAILFNTGLTQKHEHQADLEAENIIRKAGYKNTALFNLIKNLSNADTTKTTQLRLTHPVADNRIKSLQQKPSNDKFKVYGNDVKKRFDFYTLKNNIHSETL